MKKQSIQIDNAVISLLPQGAEDYISLTDMAHSQMQEHIILRWLSLKSTIEYIGEWEALYNPNFNYTEFGTIRDAAGSNNFVLSVKTWIERTNAIGIIAKAGRYGGTYAHKDIAFNFCMWISPIFQLYVVREYQRLVEIERSQLALSWNVKRMLSKANYYIQTDAIKNVILPKLNISQMKQGLVYASEADLLNLALFGCTAKQWQEANPELAKTMNIRDAATINQLIVLSNIESLNAELIKQNIAKEDRLSILHRTAKEQLTVLIARNSEQNFTKLASEDTNLIERNI